MASVNSVAKKLYDSLGLINPPTASTAPGKVSSLDDYGSATVDFGTGVHALAFLGVGANVGDMVDVEFSDGGAVVVRNRTDPPDNRIAREAVKLLVADEARIGKLEADTADIDELRANSAKVKDLTAERLNATVAFISALEADDISAASLAADVAKITNLTAEQLTATAAYIAALEAGSVTASRVVAMSGDFDAVKANAAKVANLTAQQLEADHATIEGLDSNYAHITEGVIDNATIGHADVDGLSANYATVANLTAANGRIDSLESSKADISYLQANYIDADTIDADYAHADLANVTTAQITNGVIQTAAIVDEQVFTVTGNKATISEINADNITVRNLHTSNLTVDTADGYVTIGSKKTPTKEYIDSLKDELQQEIDGAVETWTSTAVPLLDNYPASQWADAETRAKHVGDICYVQQQGSDYDGFCYRFSYSNGEFSWVLIKDSSVTKALGDISDLQEFQSDTASWIDETEQGLTTIRQNHTALSGRVDGVEATANAALPASTFSTFQSTTFKELVDEVDEQSSTITTMSERIDVIDSSLNLLPDSDEDALSGGEYISSSGNSAYISAQFFKLGSDKPQPELANGIRWTLLDGVGNKNRCRCWAGKSPALKKGEAYTVSWWMRVTSGSAKPHMESYSKGADISEFWDALTVDDGWKRIVYTFTMDDDTSNDAYQNGYFYIGVGGNNVAAVAETCGYRLVPGSSAESVDGKVATLTNTVNTVKQTADANKASITNLTTTVSDNKTAIENRASAIEQDLSGFKSTVSSTYATKTALGQETTARQTAISQLDSAIALRATKTEAYQSAQPNLTPWFECVKADTDYWYILGANTIPWSNTEGLHGYSDGQDGWAHFTLDSRTSAGNDGSKNCYFNMFVKKGALSRNITPGGKYTWLIEVKNLTWTPATSGSRIFVYPSVNNATMDVFSQPTSADVPDGIRFSSDGHVHVSVTAKSDFSALTQDTRGYVYVPTGCYADFDMRISLYEGEYAGPYKPYSGSQLYASQSELKVTADGISSEVSKKVGSSEIISKINQSAESVTIDAAKVNIAGAAIFTSGRLSQTSLNAAYDAKGAADTVQDNLDNLQIGGRNLLLWTGEGESYSSHASANRAWEYTTIYGSVAVDGNTANFTKNGSGLTNNTSGLRIMAQASSGGGASAKPGESTDYNIDIAVGDVFTFSCDAKTSGNRVALSWQYYNGSNVWTSTGIGEFVPSDADWHRYTYTFTVPSGFVCLTALGIYCQLQEGVTLSVKNAKLERGNKATDWSPAPEDVDAAIDAAQDTADAAAPKASAVARSQRIYWRATSTAGKPGVNNTWLATGGTGYGNWALTVPQLTSGSTKYPYLYTAVQSQTVAQQAAGTACSCSPVLLDDTTTVIDGGSIITNSVTANQLASNAVTAEKIAANAVTIGKLAESAQEQLAGSGFTILWDSNQGTTYAGGEAKLCLRDPLTGTVTAGSAGWVMFNGVKRTVPNSEFNPNASLPYNIPIYMVLRLSSATSATGTMYAVFYQSGWKCASAFSSPTTTYTAWTWAAATDIVLGKCVEPSSEAVFTECEIYDPPLTSTSVSSGTVTANAAAKTATNYITADSTGIKIHNASDTTNYQHQTSSGTAIYVSAMKRSETNADGLQVYDTDGTTRVASFESTARIGKDNKSHVDIDYHSMQLIDKEGNTYFHVSDLRNSEGYATLTESFVGDGETKSFNVSQSVISPSTASVEVSDAPDITISSINSRTVTLSGVPAVNADIKITYRSNSDYLKVYTLGYRKDGSTLGTFSVAEGNGTVASEHCSHAEGGYTTASGWYSHAENERTIAKGEGSHAEGSYTTASGIGSHSEGRNTTASGNFGHAQGIATTASGYCSHAEGSYTTASGEGAHSEGKSATASGEASHAEGYLTTASYESSHAEGRQSTASGWVSHAEGFGTTASGTGSHAEGQGSVASGIASHAQNTGTIAAHDNQTALGRYNVEASNSIAVVIGNGSKDSRSDMLKIDWFGNVLMAGSVKDMDGNARYTKTRVKGDAETSYRTGDVNLTPANIGAAPSNRGVPTPQTADNAKFLRNDNTWQTVTPANIGAAPSNRGVPTPETADNAKFLRNDNTWQTVTPANIGAAASSHEHSAGDITSGTLADARLPTKGSAGTAGQSSASSGATLEVPYLTTDAYGRVTAKGTHTHTIGSLNVSALTAGTLSRGRGGTGMTAIATTNFSNGGLSVANNTATDITFDGNAYFTFPSTGIFLMTCSVCFLANATGYRAVNVNNTSKNVGLNYTDLNSFCTPAASGEPTKFVWTSLVNVTDATQKWYMSVKHTAGAALTVRAYVRVVKIFAS